MKTTDYIISTINKFPKGYTFTYSDFDGGDGNREAIIKCLNRLAVSGKINKLTKGKYYKPENSSFGNLPLSQFQIVKDLLEKNGKMVGYITGYAAYNKMGLTTQISNTIHVGRNEIRAAIKRGIYKIAFVKQKNIITKDNTSMLQLLDAIRFIKIIPDTTIDNSCIRLMAMLKKLSSTEQDLMIKLALKYPPSTRALLGALMEKSIGKMKVESLKKSLNPITSYRLNVSATILPTAKNWNIK